MSTLLQLSNCFLNSCLCFSSLLVPIYSFPNRYFLFLAYSYPQKLPLPPICSFGFFNPLSFLFAVICTFLRKICSYTSRYCLCSSYSSKFSNYVIQSTHPLVIALDVDQSWVWWKPSCLFAQGVAKFFVVHVSLDGSGIRYYYLSGIAVYGEF